VLVMPYFQIFFQLLLITVFLDDINL
jgi:hypothetical protein